MITKDTLVKHTPKDNRVQINVLHFSKMPRGRFKVKIEQNGISLNTLRFSNMDLVVINNLGRGRYIMKEGK